ncbi:MAG: DNA cytosine methyltransferase [Fusobacteriaceae bacterium]
MKKPLAIDLFCGAGGMSEGIIQAGFHIVFSSDKSPEASLTYQNRHEQLGLHNGYNTFFCTEDINNLTGEFILNSISELQFFNNQFDGKIDAIFGGPPCQGFSRAGKRDKDDPRNFLFREYLRVISEVKPNYVVMENVVGLLDTKLDSFISFDSEEYPDNTLVTNILEKEFHKLGYKIKKYNEEDNVNFKKLILDASKFGVPQRRTRVIIVAYKEEMDEPKNINDYKKKDKVTIEEALSDLILDKKLREFQLLKLEKMKKLDFINSSRSGRTISFDTSMPIHLEGELPNIDLSSHSDYIVQRFTLYKEGENSKDVKNRLYKEGLLPILGFEALIQNSYNIALKTIGYSSIDEFKFDISNFLSLNEEMKMTLLDLVLSKKNIRTKLNRKEPSGTIVTLPDDYISPFEDRVFSVREMARLQSFDDSFIFLGKRTTGGPRRKIEVPQYTQVGNAVPPLLARAIAMSILDVIKK